MGRRDAGECARQKGRERNVNQKRGEFSKAEEEFSSNAMHIDHGGGERG